MPSECPRMVRLITAGLFLSLGLLAPPGIALAQPAPAKAAPVAAPKGAAPYSPDAVHIAAVVNGDLITDGDIDARRRLFAISVGLPTSAEVLGRLTAQVKQQLIDERLRLQEMLRRHVIVQGSDIAATIGAIERRNGMPPGFLQKRLAADGLTMRSMIDQYRVQIGWSRVLRGLLGPTAEPTSAEIEEREALLKSQIGQTEYEIGEVFIPISEPAQAADAQRFADLVIQQLRGGAPFAVVAAQFSQSQSALQGGDMGWVQANQLDEEVLAVVKVMPTGAISNPIRIPGGISIVALRGKREIGNDVTLMAHIRQIFVPFDAPLNPQAPNEQQRRAVEGLRAIAASARGCEGVEAATKGIAGVKSTESKDVRIDRIGNPNLRQLAATLPIDKPSEPLIAQDGVALIVVCARDTRNAGVPAKKELAEQLFSERMELLSRQLMRGLQRRAVIDLRA
jgi:peptidyl-prolyl cis-trans isomerase SurA